MATLLLHACSASRLSGHLLAEPPAPRVRLGATADAPSPLIASAVIELDSAQEPDYLTKAREVAAQAAASLSVHQTIAKKWFGPDVDLTPTGRLATVVKALPRFLSMQVLSLFQVQMATAGTVESPELVRCNRKLAQVTNLAGYNEVPRVAFVLPQPLAQSEWLNRGTSATKLNVYLCPSFTNLGPTQQSAVLVHEVLHHLGCYDIAYKTQDALTLPGSKSKFNTNSFLAYVGESAYAAQNLQVQIDAWGEMPNVDCSKLPGTACNQDADNASCWMRANTAGKTCDEYCKASGLLCRASAGLGTSTSTCARGADTFCVAKATTQFCQCTEEDLLSGMDIYPTGKR